MSIHADRGRPGGPDQHLTAADGAADCTADRTADGSTDGAVDGAADMAMDSALNHRADFCAQSVATADGGAE